MGGGSVLGRTMWKSIGRQGLSRNGGFGCSRVSHDASAVPDEVLIRGQSVRTGDTLCLRRWKAHESFRNCTSHLLQPLLSTDTSLVQLDTLAYIEDLRRGIPAWQAFPPASWRTGRRASESEGRVRPRCGSVGIHVRRARQLRLDDGLTTV